MIPRIQTEDGDFEYTTEFGGCSHCDLSRVCMRGRKMYNSRAWLCELFMPGKIGVFRRVENVLKANKNEVEVEETVGPMRWE